MCPLQNARWKHDLSHILSQLCTLLRPQFCFFPRIKTKPILLMQVTIRHDFWLTIHAHCSKWHRLSLVHNAWWMLHRIGQHLHRGCRQGQHLHRGCRQMASCHSQMYSLQDWDVHMKDCCKYVHSFLPDRGHIFGSFLASEQGPSYWCKSQSAMISDSQHMRTAVSCKDCP